jgi:hypothetical protein
VRPRAKKISKRETEPLFVKAKEITKNKVMYWGEDGSSVTYVGGNRTGEIKILAVPMNAG